MHDILRETPIYQEILKEGREEGIEQGIEQGELRGLNQAVVMAYPTYTPLPAN